MITVSEAAKRAGRDPETIRRWIRSGRLKAERNGSQHVIDEQDLEPLLENDSEIYSTALREYVARHSPDEITDALNQVLDDVGTAIDPVVSRAARRILHNSEW